MAGVNAAVKIWFAAEILGMLYVAVAPERLTDPLRATPLSLNTTYPPVAPAVGETVAVRTTVCVGTAGKGDALKEVAVEFKPKPTSVSFWVAALAFRLLSMLTTVPLMEPETVGTKLKICVHCAPAVRVNGEEAVVSSGQVEDAL